jgi:hypothetical protein
MIVNGWRQSLIVQAFLPHETRDIFIQILDTVCEELLDLFFGGISLFLGQIGQYLDQQESELLIFVALSEVAGLPLLQSLDD